MAPSTPEPLHRVVGYALQLHAALARGEPRDLAREQAVLTNLVLEVPSGDDDTRRGTRYAAVCWIDELFTCYSPWAQEWNERKLESSLYGGNDRAWEFWRQAKLAEAETTDQTLAAYYLCVALGFRGELRRDPEKLRDWVDRTRTRITRTPAPPWRKAMTSTRRTPARRLHGAARVRRMAAIAGAVLLCLLPVVTYVLVS